MVTLLLGHIGMSNAELTKIGCISINRSSRRKRGMASNPLFIIPDFFCIFQMNLAMATLGLKEMGKFLWEGMEKSLPCWLFQFSKTGLDAMPLFLLDDLLNHR